MNDGGGDRLWGLRSLTCTTGDALVAAESDRVIRVRAGRWYGMANRARGEEDAKQCRYIWGDEADIAQLRAKYRLFSPPLMTTLAYRLDGMLGSGTVGFLQYTANWFPWMRHRVVGAEFDLLEAHPGRPLPIMFALDIFTKTLRKLADAPGVSLQQDVWGCILTAQLNVGKIAVAVPNLPMWMRMQTRIRNVWPARGKPGMRVRIVGTRLPRGEGVVVRIGGGVCAQVKRWRLFGMADVVSCRVGKGMSRFRRRLLCCGSQLRWWPFEKLCNHCIIHAVINPHFSPTRGVSALCM